MTHLIIIFGPPAAGKASVGSEVSKLTGYGLFHNHLTTDPVAACIGWSADNFHEVVSEFRLSLFERTISNNIAGLIFTYVWDQGFEHDNNFIQKTTNLFEKFGGKVSFVELTASLEARLAREGSPFRLSIKPSKRDVDAAKKRLVDTDAAGYTLNTPGGFPLPHDYIRIDTETTQPETAAQNIINTFGLAKLGA